MSETMKAAIFVEPGKMTVEEVPKAMLEQDDDIVIRVVRTCVCGSDLWFFRGLSGQAAHSQVGHESIGVVEEVGAAVEYTVDLIPKIRVEVLSDDADAETLVGVIVKSAGSGTIGDGKVWVAPLDSVTRVRTGETGSAAI